MCVVQYILVLRGMNGILMVVVTCSCCILMFSDGHAVVGLALFCGPAFVCARAGGHDLTNHGWWHEGNRGGDWGGSPYHTPPGVCRYTLGGYHGGMPVRVSGCVCCVFWCDCLCFPINWCYSNVLEWSVCVYVCFGLMCIIDYRVFVS